MRPSRYLNLRPFVLSLSVLLFDCATLEKLDPGTCGNGVVDATEDCDGTVGCGTATEGAASCRLKCTAAKDCPEGWGCGISGVCRQPSGQFALISEPVSTGVDTLEVGDFDGDGRQDVLASAPRGANNAARVRVHYFGDAAVLSQVVSFAAPLASPFVRDFDGDGVSDVAFGYAGLNLMRGQRDRSFAGTIFPSITLEQDVGGIFVQAVAGALPDGSRANFLVHVGGTDPSGASVGALASTSGGNAELNVVLPAGPDKLLGESAWGVVRDGLPLSACGDVVMAFDMGNTTKVVVVSPCVRDGGAVRWWKVGDPPPLEITFPVKLTDGILLSDVDRDGRVDILGGAGDRVFIAYNTVVGDFQDPYEITEAPKDLLLRRKFPELPLAAADLNGDGVDDYVMRRGFQVSTIVGGGADAGPGVVVHTPFPSPRAGNWSRALITRLNLDAYPDVVVASEDQPDLELFAGTGNGALTPYTISTNGAVSRIAVGDLDGDQVQDIAFVETLSSGESDIAVAYGRPVGPPESPRSIGRVGKVTTMHAFPGSGTAVQNLGVFMRSGGASAGDPIETSVAIVLGSGDRQPLAPILFDGEKVLKVHQPAASTTREWEPHTVVAGHFGKADRLDLVSVAVGVTFSDKGRERGGVEPVGGWLAEGTGPLSFASPVEVVALDALNVRVGAAEVFPLQATVADVDATPDGIDELVALAGIDRGAGVGIHVLSTKALGSPIKTIPIANGRATPSNRLLVTDIDGDGKRDAVVIVASGDGANLAYALLNDGSGAFASPVPISIPPWSKAGAPPDTSPTGVSQITVAGVNAGTGSTKRRDLAITTAHRVLLASYDPATKAFSVREMLDRVGDAGLSGATAIASGDLDGDGVEDLAIADRGALRVLRQLPRLP